MTDTAGHGRGRAQVGRFPRLRRMRSSIDSWQQRRAGSAVPVAVLVRFRDQDGARWSVLLAHYGFLSLLPALLLLVTGLGYLLSGRPAFQQQVLDTAVAGVPVLGHQLRADVTSLTGSPAAIAAGVLGAVYVLAWLFLLARLFLLAAALNVVLADRLWPRPVGPLADG